MRLNILSEDKQLNLFPHKPVLLHHGTRTGKNNRVYESFKNEGAKSQVASGWGQGQGFYVWYNWANAANRAVADDRGGQIRTAMDQDGLPMVVTVKEVPTVPDWDLDTEFSHPFIIAWIRDNQQLIAPALKDWKLDINWYNQVKAAISQDSKGPREPNAIWFTKDSQVRGAPSKLHIQDDELGTGNAAKLAMFMKQIEEGNREALIMFKNLFMANLPRNVAIKYVGKTPLKVHKIMIKKDGKWIEA